MLTRFDLYYKIQKNVFMSGRISSDAYTIYYSDEQDIPYCNYAVVSDLSSVSRLLNSISEDFAKIDRKPCIYINSNQSNELRELQEYNMHVRYMEVCLRYGGNDVDMPYRHQLKKVDETNIEDYMQVYTKPENNYAFKLDSKFLDGVRKGLKAPNFYNYLVYDGKKPVSVVSLGEYKGYYMIYGPVTEADYRGKGYSQTALGACVRKFQEDKGKELYVVQPSNVGLEKLYMQHGFKKVFTGYVLY